MLITFHSSLYGKKFLLQILAFRAILSTSIFFKILRLTLALDLTPALSVKSMRSPLPPVTRLGAKSGHLRPPGPFHFGLGPGSCLGEVGPSSKNDPPTAARNQVDWSEGELAAWVSIAICGCKISKLADGRADEQTLKIIQTDYGLMD